MIGGLSQDYHFRSTSGKYFGKKTKKFYCTKRFVFEFKKGCFWATTFIFANIKSILNMWAYRTSFQIFIFSGDLRNWTNVCALWTVPNPFSLMKKTLENIIYVNHLIIFWEIHLKCLLDGFCSSCFYEKSWKNCVIKESCIETNTRYNEYSSWKRFE